MSRAKRVGLWGVMTSFGIIAAVAQGCGADASPSRTTTGDAATEGAPIGTPPSDSGASMPGDGPISPEVAARFAILVGSCSPRTKAESIVNDLYDDESPRHLRAIAACTATKNNGCLALSECAGETYTRTGADCRPRCDGDVVETCDDGILAREDCVARGLRCVTDANGKLPTCSEPGAVPCDAGIGQASCGSDGHATVCGESARVIRGPSCSDLGMTCGAGGCEGAGGTCVSEQPVSQATIAFVGASCDRGKVRACVNGGAATFDCARHVTGSSCVLASDGGEIGAAICALGTECSLGLTTVGTRTCEGDSAVICNRGRIDRVDCKVLGFTGCLVIPERSKVICTPGVQ